MYTKTGIINLALSKIGVRPISSLIEDSEQRIAATNVWEYIRDEVLEARAWHFAKTRAEIYKLDIVPAFNFNYAYVLPFGFLKLIRPIYPDSSYVIETILTPDGIEKITNGSFTGNATGWTLGAQWTYGSNKVTKAAGGVTTLSQLAVDMVSVPVVDELYLLEFNVSDLTNGSIIPTFGGSDGVPVSVDGEDLQQYIQAADATGLIFTPSASGLICSVDNVSILKCVEKLCLLTNYDADELYINFTRRITDVTRYSPSFVSALAFRLAAEVSLRLTEGMGKYEAMIALYMKALTAAEEITQSMDSLEGETGSTTWVDQ